MPKIVRMFDLEVRPEQFLEACSPLELIEIDHLLSAPRFQQKMSRERSEEIKKRVSELPATIIEANRELDKYHGNTIEGRPDPGCSQTNPTT